jgi:hypothetical protein
MAEAVTSDAESMRRLMEMADQHHDGHVTILKFTTNWRIAFGTIEWKPELPEWRDAIAAMPVGRTFAEAAGAAMRAANGIKGDERVDPTYPGPICGSMEETEATTDAALPQFSPPSEQLPGIDLFDVLVTIFPPGRAFDCSSIAAKIHDHPELFKAMAFFGARTVKTGRRKGTLTKGSQAYLARWLAGLAGRTFNGHRLQINRFGRYRFIADTRPPRFVDSV